MAAADARTRTEWTGAQLDALAEALLPAAGGTHMPGPATVATGRRALDILAGLPASLRRLVGMELRVLDRVARTTLGAPFAALSPERRRTLLDRAGRLPGLLAEAARPLELLAVLAYAGAPEVQAAIGAEPGQLLPLERPLPPARRLPVRSHPDLGPGLNETFDAVIVGSGAGGAPVARELARAGWSVAVVEEGDAVGREDFTGSDIERMGRLYRDGASTTTVGRPAVLVPIGRAVGGTTVVNSGTCFRTPDHVVAGWARTYGVDISPGGLVPFYEDVERTLGVAPVPWEVMGNNGAIAHRGATALGIPGRPLDRNAEGCHGSGVCALGCPVDGKRGVHMNYLPQAVEAGPWAWRATCSTGPGTPWAPSAWARDGRWWSPPARRSPPASCGAAGSGAGPSAETSGSIRPRRWRGCSTRTWSRGGACSRATRWTPWRTGASCWSPRSRRRAWRRPRSP